MRALAKIGNRAHAKKGNQNTRVISEITVDMQLAFPVRSISRPFLEWAIGRAQRNGYEKWCMRGRT